MPAFSPTVQDILNARLNLTRKLPVELVLQILDHAHYWLEEYTQSSDYVAVLDEEFADDFSGTKLCLLAQIFPDIPVYHKPKIREIEFTLISHDQGWTTEDTERTYTTSSWFEVSIVRGEFDAISYPNEDIRSIHSNIYAALQRIGPHDQLHLVTRPAAVMEPQRQHCEAMRRVTPSIEGHSSGGGTEEGKHAWWVQGNEVARAKSVYEGEFIKRYTVIWRNTPYHRWEGNQGSGTGEGFFETLREGDFVALWARAKRRGWENHVHGARVTFRYTI